MFSCRFFSSHLYWLLKKKKSEFWGEILDFIRQVWVSKCSDPSRGTGSNHILRLSWSGSLILSRSGQNLVPRFWPGPSRWWWNQEGALMDPKRIQTPPLRLWDPMGPVSLRWCSTFPETRSRSWLSRPCLCTTTSGHIWICWCWNCKVFHSDPSSFWVAVALYFILFYFIWGEGWWWWCGIDSLNINEAETSGGVFFHLSLRTGVQTLDLNRFLLSSVSNRSRVKQMFVFEIWDFQTPDFPFFPYPGCVCRASKTRSGNPERSGPNQTFGLWPLVQIDQIIFRSRRTITHARHLCRYRTAKLFRISWSLNLHLGDYRRLEGGRGGPKVSSSDTILRNILRKCRFLGSNCSQRPFFFQRFFP